MTHRTGTARHGVPPSQAERMRVAGRLAATGIACDRLAGHLAAGDHVPPAEFARAIDAFRDAADAIEALGSRSATPGGHLTPVPRGT